jgi:hypothetical protein
MLVEDQQTTHATGTLSLLLIHLVSLGLFHLGDRDSHP